jgi:hypothetical protein
MERNHEWDKIPLRAQVQEEIAVACVSSVEDQQSGATIMSFPSPLLDQGQIFSRMTTQEVLGG